MQVSGHSVYIFFFFNDTATTEIYTLSLHDALPIYAGRAAHGGRMAGRAMRRRDLPSEFHAVAPTRLDFAGGWTEDQKSTRLNSSHGYISYAVFCLKKKKDIINRREQHYMYLKQQEF